MLNSNHQYKLYFAPADFFYPFQLADTIEGVESGFLPFPVHLRPGKKVACIDALIDETGMSLSAEGSAGREKMTGTLQFKAVGFTPSKISKLTKMLRTPLIFFVMDRNETAWAIGNHRNRASLRTLDFTYDKTYEGFTGADAQVVFRGIPAAYNFPLSGIFEDVTVQLADFNLDFNIDFLTL